MTIYANAVSAWQMFYGFHKKLEKIIFVV